MNKDEDENPKKPSWWKRLRMPFEPRTEYAPEDNAEALRQRGVNPLAEEESVEVDESSAD